MRGSSRDEGPQKSRRRQRRRHRDRFASSKSSLVQKNDVDDVYISGQNADFAGPAGQDYYDDHPHTRKFLKQLKDGTQIAHGLKQIEEVEEQDSDGSIGSGQKYRSPAKQSRERRKRRQRERDQDAVDVPDKGEDQFFDDEQAQADQLRGPPGDDQSVRKKKKRQRKQESDIMSQPAGNLVTDDQQTLGRHQADAGSGDGRIKRKRRNRDVGADGNSEIGKGIESPGEIPLEPIDNNNRGVEPAGAQNQDGGFDGNDDAFF